ARRGAVRDAHGQARVQWQDACQLDRGHHQQRTTAADSTATPYATGARLLDPALPGERSRRALADGPRCQVATEMDLGIQFAGWGVPPDRQPPQVARTSGLGNRATSSIAGGALGLFFQPS